MINKLWIDDRQCIELVPIPLGGFLMGSSIGLPLELPVHQVVIGKPFFIGKVPVTQAQWLAVMGNNPSGFADSSDSPVGNVTWEDAKKYCNRLTAKTGREVRLPSETEWEYACRAGTTGEYFFGESETRLVDFAWFDENSKGRTHPVGLKNPNPWGLHDMIGNVWEWCEDVWHSDYEGAPTDGSAWLDGAEHQPRRSLRGGSWNFDSFRCRSAYRSREWKHFPTDHFGFRIVVSVS